MKEIERTIIPINRGRKVRSLCWHGDELIDWAGSHRYQLDGTSSGLGAIYAYRFDHAISSHNGEYVVLYEQLGTKGLILKNGGLDLDHVVLVGTMSNGFASISKRKQCYRTKCFGFSITQIPSWKRHGINLFYERICVTNEQLLVLMARTGTGPRSGRRR